MSKMADLAAFSALNSLSHCFYSEIRPTALDDSFLIILFILSFSFYICIESILDFSSKEITFSITLLCSYASVLKATSSTIVVGLLSPTYIVFIVWFSASKVACGSEVYESNDYLIAA